jgi:hypothetical protein
VLILVSNVLEITVQLIFKALKFAAHLAKAIFVAEVLLLELLNLGLLLCDVLVKAHDQLLKFPRPVADLLAVLAGRLKLLFDFRVLGLKSRCLAYFTITTLTS